jgi:transcriptional regulator with XRE-family HTH domain
MALSALSFAQKVTNDPARLPPSRSPNLSQHNYRVAHVCRPFANQNRRGTMDRLARVTPQDFPATAPRKDSASLAERVREALTADFGHLKARQKEIARKAGGISPRTVERWERGEGVPHLELFLELGKHSPALRAVALRCWAMEADCDPGFQRELIAFLQSRVKA